MSFLLHHLGQQTGQAKALGRSSLFKNYKPIALELKYDGISVVMAIQKLTVLVMEEKGHAFTIYSIANGYKTDIEGVLIALG